MSIRWITPYLGTAPAEEVVGRSDVSVIDVRNLVDKEGNDLVEVRERVMTGVASVKRGLRTVIACDYGISRSNAIAAGVLSVADKLPFVAAVRKVMETTGENEIKSAPLNAVHLAISGGEPTQPNTRPACVLVTGAGGALGPSILSRLRDTIKVLSPARSEVDLESGTTALDIYVEEHGINTIVHLASPRVFTSNLALGKTLTMLRNVLDVCKNKNVRLVYPSGWEVYSGYTGQVYANESFPSLPSGPYGETKFLAEQMIDHWRRTSSLRCSIVRSSPVYGAGLPKPKFIYNFVGKARRNETILTHRYLNGEPMLDLLHVGDFAAAIQRVLLTTDDTDFNIGTGVLTSTLDVAKIIRELTGSQSSIGYTQVASHAASVAMNTDKARRLLGWAAMTDLRSGLDQLINSNLQETKP